jgi:hypothetical protein
MKKMILLALILIATPNLSFSEVDYNYKNPLHSSDKDCVGVFSVVRDALFGDINIDTNKLKASASPDTSLAGFMSEMTSLQNKFILKYNRSRQFNDHYRAHKILVTNRISTSSGDYLVEELFKCIT